jgi:GxxExxY protein
MVWEKIFIKKAFGKELEKTSLKYEREKIVNIKYKNKEIGKYRIDFIVENKIIVEIKTRYSLGYLHIKQVMNYLKTLNCKLAIIIYFTREGVKYRRVLNPDFKINNKLGKE